MEIICEWAGRQVVALGGGRAKHTVPASCIPFSGGGRVKTQPRSPPREPQPSLLACHVLALARAARAACDESSSSAGHLRASMLYLCRVEGYRGRRQLSLHLNTIQFYIFLGYRVAPCSSLARSSTLPGTLLRFRH